MPADVKQSDREKVLAALDGAARLTRTEVFAVFGRQRNRAQIEALGQALEADGQIMRLRIEPTGGRYCHPMEVWEKVTSQSRPPENGSTPGPPAGEGWLPKAKTLRHAQRGVMPAHAARVGKRLRRKENTGGGVTRVTDEHLGSRYLIHTAFRNLRDQGVIEVQGDWIRLTKNPPRRPAQHWYEGLLHFLAEAHPTLDGKWRRKPKRTLVPFTEHLLGRRLEPDESVTRRRGRAGSWNPADIIVAGDAGVRYLADMIEEDSR